MYHERTQITRGGPEYDPTPKTLQRDTKMTDNKYRKITITRFLEAEYSPDTWVPSPILHNFLGYERTKNGIVRDRTSTNRYTLSQLVNDGYLERRGTTKDTEYKLIKLYPDPIETRIKTIAKVYQALTPDTWKTTPELSKELSIPPKTIQMALRQLKYDKRISVRIRFPLLNGHKTKIIEYQQDRY